MCVGAATASAGRCSSVVGGVSGKVERMWPSAPTPRSTTSKAGRPPRRGRTASISALYCCAVQSASRPAGDGRIDGDGMPLRHRDMRDRRPPPANLAGPRPSCGRDGRAARSARHPARRGRGTNRPDSRALSLREQLEQCRRGRAAGQRQVRLTALADPRAQPVDDEVQGTRGDPAAIGADHHRRAHHRALSPMRATAFSRACAKRRSCPVRSSDSAR